MPYSSKKGKEIITGWLSKKRDYLKCMVDFGAGAGYYGKLFEKLQPQCTRIAIEAFEPYIEKFNLFRLYHDVLVADVSKMELPEADIAVCGDIIEHLSKDVATDFIKRIDEKYRYVIVSIPFGSYPQGAVGGNEYERHLSTWSYNELCDIFKNFKIRTSCDNIAVFIKN